MRTKKEMKELARKLDELCWVVKERFRSGSDVSISFSYGKERDHNELTYLRMVPSKEDSVLIEMKK